MSRAHREFAVYLSIAIWGIAALSALLFILMNSWNQWKVAIEIALLTVIGLLQLPTYAERAGQRRSVWRILAGIAGLAVWVSSIGFVMAFGTGNWKISSAGFVLGMYCTSLLLMRYGASGATNETPES